MKFISLTICTIALINVSEAAALKAIAEDLAGAGKVIGKNMWGATEPIRKPVVESVNVIKNNPGTTAAFGVGGLLLGANIANGGK